MPTNNHPSPPGLQPSGRWSGWSRRVRDWMRPATADHAAVLALPGPEQALGAWAARQAAIDQYAILSMTDAQGRITFVNQRFCDTSGYSAEQLLGQTYALVNAGHHPSAFFANLWQAISNGRPWKGEICNRHPSGATYWLDTTIVPQRAADGAVTHHVAIHHDITETKVAGLALEQSRQRFRSLLALSTDWFWEQDAELRFTRLSGGPESSDPGPAHLMGKRRWELDVDTNDEGWAEHREAVEARRAFRNFEYRQRAGDEWRWYSVSGEPVFDSAGRFCGYRGVSREVTSRRSVQDRLWRLANVDTLTGLPNRMMFQERLAQAVQQGQASGEPFAVALLDLDNFKEINDTLGHDGGDTLLKAVAQRLQRVLRQSDLVARIGGDEFAAILHGAASVSALRRPLEGMHAALTEPIAIGDEMRRCTFSMGVTLYPDDAGDGTDLVKNADIALYRAKAAGRNRFEFFKQDMRSAVQRRVSMCREIEAALQADALMLYYQPVLDLAQGRVVGVEALLRWNHPTLGVLTPGTFARAFDDAALAAQIGQRVVQLSVAQAERWLKDGIEFGRLAINVVAADFASERFAGDLAETLAAHEVPASRFAIEVTEGMFLGRSAGPATAGLQQLHDMGVEIAFDDFGTGYASLTHLKSLPIDRLKIDRSFVAGLTRDGADASIVLAIVQLGKSLGKSITAEGVETPQQMALLREMGCHVVQGFAYARPMPASELPAYIQHFTAQEQARDTGTKSA
ncbi:MAG: EAL domain-containing protein [Pseudomonadota bacterium]